MAEPSGTADAFDSIEADDVTDASDARAGFDARFERARQRLLRIAGSLVGAQEAEDVVHDTYLLGRRRFDQSRDGPASEMDHPNRGQPVLLAASANQAAARPAAGIAACPSARNRHRPPRAG